MCTLQGSKLHKENTEEKTLIKDISNVKFSTGMLMNDQYFGHIEQKVYISEATKSDGFKNLLDLPPPTPQQIRK